MRVDAADQHFIAQHEPQIDLVRWNRQRSAVTGHAQRGQHAIVRQKLHGDEKWLALSGALDDEINWREIAYCLERRDARDRAVFAARGPNDVRRRAIGRLT